MKKILITFILNSLFLLVSAQEAKFIAKVSKTMGHLDTKFKIEFSLENANGSQFTPPNFEDFTIVGGPSTSSNMSIINGTVTQSLSYIYLIKPKKIGNLTVPPATIKVNGEVLKTEKLKIKVEKSNTEDEEEAAIKENERQSPSPNADNNDFFEQFFGRQPVPKKEEAKKKRKTYTL
jgi:BatD DUF11 like domain